MPEIQTSDTEPTSQIDAVIASGYCIGCGSCAAWPDSPFAMIINQYGVYEAQRTTPAGSDHTNTLDRICPFSDEADNEDTIAKETFGESGAPHPMIGYCVAAYAGHVNEGNFRNQGSSGGMGSWLANMLLAQNRVDAIVHVVTAKDDGREPMFRYSISWNQDSLRNGAKSKYYPVTLVEVLKAVRTTPGRYAFVGLPCFIKTIRLWARHDAEFSKSVAYCIGLVCGHLKTQAFAECLGWQLGIAPDQLAFIDFRKKLPNESANRYGIEVTGRASGRMVTRIAPVKKLFGCDWGMGLFKPKACDYCDDVMAETADITIGDAWLPKYVSDSRGTNILVVRRRDLVALIEDAREAGKVTLDDLNPDEVAESQASGLAHRREGLACRLWLADSEGRWRPKKRVAAIASDTKAPLFLRQKLRIALRERSHVAFLEAKQRGDLTYFLDQLVPLGEEYRDITRSPVRRLLARIRSQFRRPTRYTI
jgi:coenzyme F420 hydrogenase subunit beta